MRLIKELASKGALTVLRHGFKCFGRICGLPISRRIRA